LEIRYEHRQIYEAIAQRDSEAAVQLIRNHLPASKQRVIQELQNLAFWLKKQPTYQKLVFSIAVKD
jgi:DNA-binding GntR family transcriptional regulator